MRHPATAGALLAAALLAAAAAPRAARADEAEAPPVRLRLAAQTEAAFGLYPGSFYNHLAGIRLDARVSPHVAFGGYVGYVNLKGKEGRAHDVLPYAQVEYLFGRPEAPVRVPLRFASGYLPRNGPVARLATGLAFALSPKVSLVTELLAPMFWITRDQMVLSTDVSLELGFTLD